jgi:hypothetical protein
MQKAGVDLMKYGERESSLRRQALEASKRDIPSHFLDIRCGYAICDLSYSANPAKWSFQVCKVGTMPVFRQLQPPGAWPQTSLSPTIFWAPDIREYHGGLWLWAGRSYEIQLNFAGWNYKGGVLWRYGKPMVMEEAMPELEVSVFQDLVTGTQDDSGALMLLLSRDSASKRARRRSASSPPPLNRRRLDYRRPGRVGRHGWLGDYHLCPRSRLYQLCRNTWRTYRPKDDCRWEAWTRGEHYNCAGCLAR